ncbi:helix-turn-helix transcriptional regulator [Paenibacillus sp. FSL K6-1330]|uniref:helix-turn-helix domain-containing protein n=1 Tax=Paenibacillus sp. FSL K6-1330 TaxID=2975292 RepID=UPI0030DA07D5
MKYANLLSQYIEKSGLSLGEISRRAKKAGISIDRSYISKLKNNDVKAPSDEISRALAEITGGDAEGLMLAGYLDEFLNELPPKFRPLLKDNDDVQGILKTIVPIFNEAFVKSNVPEMVVEDDEFNDFTYDDTRAYLQFAALLMNKYGDNKLKKSSEPKNDPEPRIKVELTEEKYFHTLTLTLDGQEITDEEKTKVIAYLRVDRQLNSKNQ